MGQNLGELIILEFWRGKMLANLLQLTLATLVNLEFGWVEYWQMALILPKFSPQKFCAIRYMTCTCSQSFM